MMLTPDQHSSHPPLAGRVACVTGAGRGIGRETAITLAHAGAHVMLLSRTRAELEQLADEIQGHGGLATPLPCDVLDQAAVEEAFNALPQLDILINNAGGNTPASFVDVTSSDLDRLIALNVRAAFLVAQVAVRRMLQQSATTRMRGGSAVVHVTSQMGRVGSPRRTVYCMCKHAVEGLTKAMAVELAPLGIRVNAVAPTFLETPMTAPFFAADPGFERWVLDRIPLGRLGTVDEVAQTILFLCSPSASLITGESLATDGGWTAQ